MRSSARSRGSRTRSSSATRTSTQVALVGIHTRGVPLAQRLRRLIAERSGVEVALGAVDITFYRDDVARPRRRRAAARAAGRALDRARLPARGDDRACSSTTSSTPAARSAPRSRRSSTTAARRASSSPCLVDRGHRELPIRPDYVGKNLPTARERADPGAARRGRRGRPRPAHRLRARRRPMADIRLVTSDLCRPAAAAPAPALDRRPDARRRRADARHRAARFAALARARGEEAADAARAARSSTSSTSPRRARSSSFELAAKRLSADTMTIKRRGLVGRQGRVAQGHGAHARAPTTPT